MKQILQAFSISGFRAPGMLSALENMAVAWKEEMTAEQVSSQAHPPSLPLPPLLGVGAFC